MRSLHLPDALFPDAYAGTSLGCQTNMMPRFRYIEALFGFAPDQSHICVPAGADHPLERMVDDVLGTKELIAIYIPAGTADVYKVNEMRGRVVGAVRLLPMPKGRTTADYSYKDWDGTLRWPIGWPCEAVYAPPVDQCPLLKPIVEMLFGPDLFRTYTARFQQGPFPLESNVARELEKRFARFAPLS